MDPTSVPLELISYRGLLKSFDDIRRGNFMQPKNDKFNADSNGDKESNSFGSNNVNIFNSIKNVMIFTILLLVNSIERLLYFLMSGYDDYVYSPLQKCLSPICKLMPRYLSLGANKQIPIFTANIITLSRTFLVIPIAWFLKYDYNMAALWCVVFHDFLDHLDGIVAKVQRITYPNHDDPLLGGFLDAFCDKIVNVLSVWTILQTANFDGTSSFEKIACLSVCYAVIAYETVIGIVRVEDYFNAQFKKRYCLEQESKVDEKAAQQATAASMEGKLKEKLESTGIALLCMAISKTNQNQIINGWGISGLICLLLTLRMAHKSLMLKLKARKTNVFKLKADNEKTNTKTRRVDEDEYSADDVDESRMDNVQMKMIDFEEEDSKEAKENGVDAESTGVVAEPSYMNYKKPRKFLHKSDFARELSEALRIQNEEKKQAAESGALRKTNRDSEEDEEYDDEDSESDKNESENDKRVDKVYTVGCFDLFHHGHIQLLKRMRQYGKRVIVGVHDSRSIYKLKKRVPVDSTEKRMLNVKAYADEVFCVAGTDPSNFISSIVSLRKNENAYYIRGNDMPDFPSKNVVESLMPIKLLPYTEGVSSTKLRNEKFAHVDPNDQEYLEKNA